MELDRVSEKAGIFRGVLARSPRDCYASAKTTSEEHRNYRTINELPLAVINFVNYWHCKLTEKKQAAITRLPRHRWLHPLGARFVYSLDLAGDALASRKGVFHEILTLQLRSCRTKRIVKSSDPTCPDDVRRTLPAILSPTAQLRLITGLSKDWTALRICPAARKKKSQLQRLIYISMHTNSLSRSYTAINCDKKIIYRHIVKYVAECAFISGHLPQASRTNRARHGMGGRRFHWWHHL